MTFIVGAAVQMSEGAMTGFDARHTLSHAAIMGALARDEPFARALARLCPTFATLDHATDTTALNAELERARAEFAAGDLSRGASRLIPFLELEEAAASVLEVLAEGCLIAGRFEDGRAIALRCLDGDPVNPRALCIAGECELALGNKKTAQAHLAKCARIARKLPDHIEDMRTAQRLLLQMHFG